jgi:hypothetical protein
VKARNRVKVWKHPMGFFMWDCRVETCKAPDDKRHGASVHWEIAHHNADDHAREYHRPAKHTPRDMGTPPGGTHFDWSDTGMHLRVRLED